MSLSLLAFKFDCKLSRTEQNETNKIVRPRTGWGLEIPVRFAYFTAFAGSLAA